MALWRHNGHGLVKADLSARDLGADVYLCCPGPSLASVEEECLHVPGAVVATMNTAYPAIRRPDIWIASDLPQCFDASVWFQPFTKINRVVFADELVGGRPLKSFPNTFFADLGSGDMLDLLQKREPDTFFVWPDSTLTFVLHVLLWMGAKRLFLVGCDFGGGADYHDGRVLPVDLRDENQRLYHNQANDVGRLAQAARPLGIHIVSCTENSRANKFIPYLPLADAITQTVSRAEIPEWTPRHIRDVERDRFVRSYSKRDEPAVQRGVLVGVLGEQADLLEWWWAAYREHNSLPVAFALFDCSDEIRAWCSARGAIVDPAPPSSVKGWFRKPFGILRSPFRVSLCLDLDCEVTGPVEPLFDAHEVGRVDVAMDNYADHAERKVPEDMSLYDTGALVIDWDSPALVDWAAATTCERYDARGDQEVFSLAVSEKAWCVEPFPRVHFDAWFACKDRDMPLLKHWCGAGKDEVRKIMEKPAPTPAVVTAPVKQKILIDFWHGLGDNILCMPAVRKLKAKTGAFIGFAMARCHAPASLHDMERSIDRVHYISTPWDHFNACRRGRDVSCCLVDTHMEAELIAARYGYDRVFHVDLDHIVGKANMHKLLCAAEQLGVELHGNELRTSYEYDAELARTVLRGRKTTVPSKYVFFHGSASVERRRIAAEDAERLCLGLGIDLPVVQVEDVVDPTRCPISVAAHLIMRSAAVVVCDSVMYHLAVAMGKRVDCVWFADPGTRAVVRPLVHAEERVLVGREALQHVLEGNPPSCGVADAYEMMETVR